MEVELAMSQRMVVAVVGHPIDHSPLVVVHRLVLVVEQRLDLVPLALEAVV